MLTGKTYTRVQVHSHPSSNEFPLLARINITCILTLGRLENGSQLPYGPRNVTRRLTDLQHRVISANSYGTGRHRQANAATHRKEDGCISRSCCPRLYRRDFFGHCTTAATSEHDYVAQKQVQTPRITTSADAHVDPSVHYPTSSGSCDNTLIQEFVLGVPRRCERELWITGVKTMKGS